MSKVGEYYRELEELGIPIKSKRKKPVKKKPVKKKEK